MNKFKNLKFYSRDRQQILEALDLFEQLGYSLVDECLNSEEAEDGEGLCAWGDGEITEGWLDDVNFEQVTLEGLKEMVGEYKEVLWLNIETLEERVINDGKKFYSDVWVKVPEGATFATGDKDNFLFRKDGWYYEDGEWFATNVYINESYKHPLLKLFWVKGNQVDNVKDVFTPKHLLGCEVKVVNCYGEEVVGYIQNKIIDSNVYEIDFGGWCDYYYQSKLTFFTEDGDELTFDEYVELYYPCG